MRAAYGVALVVGLIALITWVIAVAASRTDIGSPEQRFGLSGRRVVGALIAFGMGGLSAAYGGWPPWAAVIAAGTAAAAAIWYVGTV
ncbi:hypothetical protein BMS3Abin02_01038 [bacterium BMS3Abin02]|nr:hypothetical protein BMS3Abin02_01038 [bacterium BMS3Abin02]GBE23184.1 hypothetical protein BMS3Bbin01_02568 [bacterium BMS3Bbin01]HDH26052.1 hypothetical protein [Actinomycetota bacterium]HDL49050.1 hypothetical protein [Actinomycetota bacterium]